MKYLLAVFALILANMPVWAASAPINDAFAKATVIKGVPAPGYATTLNGTNVGASSETSEPVHANVGVGKSVWWSWTPTTTGTATIDTAGSSFDTVLAVYTSNTLASLVPVAYSDDASATVTTSKVTFTVRGGTTYYIAVDGYKGAANVSSGIIKLNVSLGVGTQFAQNDNYANRAVVAGDYAIANGDTGAATLEPNEPTTQIVIPGTPPFTVTYFGDTKSIWWTWTAPRSGTVTITNQMDINSEFSGDNLTALLEVFADDAQTGVGGLTWLNGVESPGFTPSETATLTETVTAGQVLQIRVSSWDAFLGAQVKLTVAMGTGGPINDRFIKESPIGAVNTIVQGTNVGATADVGEPAHAGLAATSSVWWSWVAPDNGYVTIDTAGSVQGSTPLDTTLEAYVGTTLASLVSVASNDDVSPTDVTSRVHFAVFKGTTYHIAVDSRGGTGTINLTTHFLPDAPVITTQPLDQTAYVGDLSATFSISNTGATAIYDWQRKAVGTTTWVHYIDGTSSIPVDANDTVTCTLTVPTPAATVTAAMNGDQFRCVITNSAGQLISKTVTLKVLSLATFTGSRPVATDIGMVFSATPPGATATYYASGLPAGLTINKTTGVISGAITAGPGTYTVTYWTVTVLGKVQTKSKVQTAIIAVQAFPAAITGSFEGFLLDGLGVPSGKMSLLVGKPGTFTGTLTYKGKVYSLRNTLLLNSVGAPTQGDVTVVPATTLSLAITVKNDSTMTATLKDGGILVGDMGTDGTLLKTYTTALPAPWAGTYTLAFTNPTTGPEGSGYGFVTISATGLLTLRGKLPDGMVVTASMPTDISANGQYRLYLPLYTNNLGYLAGWLPLSLRGVSGLYHITAGVGSDVWWSKPANIKDKVYPGGFGPAGLSVVMEPWAPSAKPYLIGSLGLVTLSNSQTVGNFAITLKQTGGVDNTGANPQVLPTSAKLDVLNRVTVLDATNPTGWKVTVTPNTGFFTGSFTLSDKRKITFEGVMLQLLSPVSADVFGRGFFQVPPVTTTPPSGSILSGDIKFLIP